MVLINNTNIIVDEFSYGKRNPFQKYIYFLTHMHSDHYQGMSSGWNYGKIYCSKVTKQLLFNKFPALQAQVIVLEYDKPNKIVLNQENNIQITVYLFDANHCAGSVMFLFEGYMGRILHTGDLRFHPSMFYTNKILYPDYQSKAETKASSIQIDELIFDNTFCDQIFKFPKREEVLEMIIEIIEKNVKKRILICIDSIGKEELVIALAKHFQTLIVVSEERFSAIRCMDLDVNQFTTNRADGFIEIIRKSDRKQRLEEDKNTVAITATGWANCSKYISPDNRNYIVPYSLHSNYEEIELFVMSICPGYLIPVVPQNLNNKSEKIRNIVQFSSYMISLMHLKQRGFEFFQQNYTNSNRLSKEYRNLMSNSDYQQKIQKQLGLILTKEEIQDMNSSMFEKSTQNKFGKNRTQKNGAKLNQSVKLSTDQQKVLVNIKNKQEILLQKRELDKYSLQQSQNSDISDFFQQNSDPISNRKNKKSPINYLNLNYDQGEYKNDNEEKSQDKKQRVIKELKMPISPLVKKENNQKNNNYNNKMEIENESGQNNNQIEQKQVNFYKKNTQNSNKLISLQEQQYMKQQQEEQQNNKKLNIKQTITNNDNKKNDDGLSKNQNNLQQQQQKQKMLTQEQKLQIWKENKLKQIQLQNNQPFQNQFQQNSGETSQDLQNNYINNNQQQKQKIKLTITSDNNVNISNNNNKYVKEKDQRLNQLLLNFQKKKNKQQ